MVHWLTFTRSTKNLMKVTHVTRQYSTTWDFLSPDYNVAAAISGATCDESSHSDPDHTCLNALLDDDSYWQTDEEGFGAWIKVSFPRANVQKLGFVSGCNIMERPERLSVSLDDATEDPMEVSYPVLSFWYVFWYDSLCVIMVFWSASTY